MRRDEGGNIRRSGERARPAIVGGGETMTAAIMADRLFARVQRGSDRRRRHGRGTRQNHRGRKLRTGDHAGTVPVVSRANA